MLCWLAACVMAAVLSLPIATAQVSDTEAVVIPFDFVSRFDGGKMGRKLAEMFWQKLERRGRFIIPESVADVRDYCTANNVHVSPRMPLERIRQIVREHFAAHIGIWGSVERADGHRYDVYDIEILIVDFRHQPPRVVYHKKARTQTVSEIPHVYVREALDALYGTKTPRPDRRRRAPQWPPAALGPNLVRGDFEHGRDHPEGWDRLPRHVSWVREGSKNRLIRFDIPEPVAATSGVLYYSRYFPIKAGTTYVLKLRWRSTGTAAKVFVKCYDALPTRFRRRSGRGSQAAALPSDRELREVYRLQANLKGPAGRWNVHVESFTPRHSRYTPRWARVMLYGYWPAGTVEWDDIEVRELRADASSGAAASTATGTKAGRVAQ